MSSHSDPNNSSRAYTGPTVSEMITSHTLAQNIIKYHDHPSSDQILDDNELDLLKRFVNSPDERDQILKDHSLAENFDDVTGQYSGSLVGYVVVRHKNDIGESVEPVLTNDEIEMLKKWFQSGKREGRQCQVLGHGERE